MLLAVFDTTRSRTSSRTRCLPAATPGAPKTVLCASTCDPDRIAALIGKVAPQLRMIEAPVSGSSAQVRNGDGVGLIGGARDTIDSVADILDALYPKWFNMGAAGNGGRAKLAINHMLGLNRLVLAEGLVFAERLGLDAKSFLDVARQSAAYSQVMDIKGAKMVSGDYSAQGFIHQSLKDFRLILAQAASRGQEMPLAALNAAVLEACVNAWRRRARQRRGDRGDQAAQATPPHPEEHRAARVSKDGRARRAILRDAASRRSSG